MSDTPRADAFWEISTRQHGLESSRIVSSGEALDFCRSLERSLSEAVTFQLASRNADSLDAERYRFLRNGAAFDECGPSVCSGCSDLFEYHWGAEVDEVVDEAMARWKAAGSPVSKETA